MSEYSEPIRQCALELRNIQKKRDAAKKPIYKLEKDYQLRRLELIKMLAEKNR